MTDNIAVYGKNTGKPPVSLTVRIEWLPDGTIKPLLFWAPDGTCLKVVALYESVPLACLKNRGAGLRFFAHSEIIETPEPCSELMHTRYDTYLYLADRRFCEKNIIDGRYSHAGKEYIPVTLDVFPDGSYEIVSFSVNGARYAVEKTVIVEPRGSFGAGGAGLWHKVEALPVNDADGRDPGHNEGIRRTASLYLELNKWFVYVKERLG